MSHSPDDHRAGPGVPDALAHIATLTDQFGRPVGETIFGAAQKLVDDQIEISAARKGVPTHSIDRKHGNSAEMKAHAAPSNRIKTLLKAVAFGLGSLATDVGLTKTNAFSRFFDYGGSAVQQGFAALGRVDVGDQVNSTMTAIGDSARALEDAVNSHTPMVPRVDLASPLLHAAIPTMEAFGSGALLASSTANFGRAVNQRRSARTLAAEASFEARVDALDTLLQSTYEPRPEGSGGKVARDDSEKATGLPSARELVQMVWMHGDTVDRIRYDACQMRAAERSAQTYLEPPGQTR